MKEKKDKKPGFIRRHWLLILLYLIGFAIGYYLASVIKSPELIGSVTGFLVWFTVFYIIIRRWKSKNANNKREVPKGAISEKDNNARGGTSNSFVSKEKLPKRIYS